MSDDPVDQINRFAITIVALLVCFGALLIVLLSWGATSDTVDRVRDFAGFLDDLQTRSAKVIVTLGAVITVLVMVMLLIVEMTPSPLQRMRVRNVKSGEATLTTVEIAGRIEQEVQGIPHVADCEAIVAARGQRIDIALELHVDAAADLAATADEACRRAQTLVEQQMNIGVATPPRARLHYRELRLRDGGRKLPEELRRPSTGWERPGTDEGVHDERGSTQSSEEAQA